MRPMTSTSLLITALIAASVGVAAPATAAPPEAEVYIVQGISGQNLDIEVDGQTVEAAAAPKTVVGPLALTGGAHTITVGDITKKIQFSGLSSTDVVAHPATSAQDAPELTAFANDTAAVGRGKVRLTVAHTASAPPADIKVDGDVLFSNVANSEALTVVVPSGTYKVEVVPAATAGEPILGPVDLPIKAGTLTRVFAIGDVSKGTMDAVVHAIPIASTGADAPGSVQTGDGGQAATEFVSGGSSSALTGAGAGLLLLLGIALIRLRRVAR